LGSSNSGADFFSHQLFFTSLLTRLPSRNLMKAGRADRRFYFGGVLSMAARSASEHDWAYPRRFYRRGDSAILLLKLCWESVLCLLGSPKPGAKAARARTDCALAVVNL
jgi:hypothetical protein